MCMSTDFYDPCCQMCLSYVGVLCVCVRAHVKVEVSGEGNRKCMYKPGLNCVFVCCQ